MGNIILQAGGGSGGVNPWKKVLGNSTFSLSQEELTGITSIRPYAFYSSQIQSIGIPQGVTEIGDYAFQNCYQITDIYYDGTMSDWSNVSKGTGWDSGTGNYTIHCTDGDIPKS